MMGEPTECAGIVFVLTTPSMYGDGQFPRSPTVVSFPTASPNGIVYYGRRQPDLPN